VRAWQSGALWGWVVVTDPEVKRQIAAWYLEGWERVYGRRREEILAAPRALSSRPAGPHLARDERAGPAV
jgi:hypothetical protein